MLKNLSLRLLAIMSKSSKPRISKRLRIYLCNILWDNGMRVSVQNRFGYLCGNVSKQQETCSISFDSGVEEHYVSDVIPQENNV